MRTIHLDLGENGYDIFVGHDLLGKAGELLNLNRKVLVVTDSGVPAEYAKTVAAQCRQASIVTFPQGELSKNMDTWKMLLEKMLEAGFSRKDCVVGVGGGVTGDLSGFAAAAYMRGIDFYNIPTTVLSQVDSSIGGKTAVDFCGYKNIIGAFHQPRGVLVDLDTLKTLPYRQVANGLAEAVKMSLTFDADLFSVFENWENEDPDAVMERVITGSLMIKKDVVEKDEKEAGLRKVLNFGHTIGHGIESLQGEDGLLHGECVGLGMLPVCGKELRPRLEKVMRMLKLPTELPGKIDTDAVVRAMGHDKKAADGTVTETFVDEAGSFYFKEVTLSELNDMLGDSLVRQ